MKKKGKSSFESFVAAIIWIGFSLDPSIGAHQKLIEVQPFTKNDVGVDDSVYFKWLELTSLGEPICINEYATRIAQVGKSIHVVQLNDFQSDMPYRLKQENINYYVQFYEMVLQERSGR